MVQAFIKILKKQLVRHLVVGAMDHTFLNLSLNIHKGSPQIVA